MIRTAVGTGLFDFGHRDGLAGQALLPYPLGVTALPDGSVAVSDTYNNALRRYDPATGEVSTLATGLREPSDAAVADGDIVVVESAGHPLTRMHLPEETVRMAGVAHRARRAPTEVAAGPFRLDVVFSAPAGQELDERYGPATRPLVSATPPELLATGAGQGTELRRDLVLGPSVTEGVLHVPAMAASCDDPAGGTTRPGTGEGFPACHVHQQDWGVPIRLTPDGDTRLALALAGLDEMDPPPIRPAPRAPPPWRTPRTWRTPQTWRIRRTARTPPTRRTRRELSNGHPGSSAPPRPAACRRPPSGGSGAA